MPQRCLQLNKDPPIMQQSTTCKGTWESSFTLPSSTYCPLQRGKDVPSLQQSHTILSDEHEMSYLWWSYLSSRHAITSPSWPTKSKANIYGFTTSFRFTVTLLPEIVKCFLPCIQVWYLMTDASIAVVAAQYCCFLCAVSDTIPGHKCVFGGGVH